MEDAMSQDGIGLVRRCYEAFGRGDIDTIVAALAPDVEWEIVGRTADHPLFGPRQGPAAVRDFFRFLSENQEFSDFSPREFHEAGGKVFVLGHYEARLKKNGRSAASDWVHVFTIEGGRIAAFREYSDTARLAEAWRA
jgi:ketosteroid isomerase-like protein